MHLSIFMFGLQNCTGILKLRVNSKKKIFVFKVILNQWTKKTSQRYQITTLSRQEDILRRCF